jgi:hypothetical protein
MDDFPALYSRVRRCAKDIAKLQDKAWRRQRDRINHPILGHINLAVRRSVQLEILVRRLDEDHIQLREALNAKTKDKRLETLLATKALLDVESTYIFANLLLDCWARLIAHALNLRKADDFSFAKLYYRVHKRGNLGRLNWLRKSCGKEITECHLFIRLFRNDKIEHVKAFWSQELLIGDTEDKFVLLHEVSLDDVNFDEYADLMWEPVNLLHSMPASFQNLIIAKAKNEAKKQDQGFLPPEANPMLILRVLIDHLHDLTDIQKREQIINLYKMLGTSVNRVGADLNRLVTVFEKTIPVITEELVARQTT